MNSTVDVLQDYVSAFNSSMVFPHVNGTITVYTLYSFN